MIELPDGDKFDHTVRFNRFDTYSAPMWRIDRRTDGQQIDV